MEPSYFQSYTGIPFIPPLCPSSDQDQSNIRPVFLSEIFLEPGRYFQSIRRQCEHISIKKSVFCGFADSKQCKSKLFLIEINHETVLLNFEQEHIKAGSGSNQAGVRANENIPAPANHATEKHEQPYIESCNEAK